MTTIAKPQKDMAQSPSLESFEETYKTAYSHGLESIYAIETVDLKSVKKIQEISLDSEHLEQEEPTIAEQTNDDPQLEFDFGELYRDWMKPLFLQEPIQVLCLSSQAESSLIENGKDCIEDLFETDLRNCVHGQGHLDEIQKKIKSYINGRSIKKTNSIEFRSLILNLIVGMNFKKAALFLKDFNLSEIVPLNLGEQIEVRNSVLTAEGNTNQKVYWEFHEKERLEKAQEAIQKFTHLFIIPWMRTRGGMATTNELMERLEKVSEDSSQARLVMEFLSVVYSQGNFPFAQFLFEPEKDLYFSDAHFEEAYREIIRKAKTYFYQPAVFYPLEQLTQFLYREFAKQWKAVSLDFIRTCLRRSRLFQTRRTATGLLEITMK